MNDLDALIPSSCTIAFPRQDSGVASGAWTVYTVTLTSLSLSQYGGAAGFPATKVIRSSCVANWTGGGAAANDTELSALATQIATDYYLWALALLDERFVGAAAWPPEPYHDVEWEASENDLVSCRVRRAAWDEQIADLLHYSPTAGSGGVVFPNPAVFLGTITFAGSETHTGASTYTSTSTIVHNSGSSDTYSSGSTSTYGSGTTVNYNGGSVVNVVGATWNYTDTTTQTITANKTVTITGGSASIYAFSVPVVNITSGAWTYSSGVSVTYASGSTLTVSGSLYVGANWWWAESTYSLTADQTDWNPANRSAVLRVSTDATRTIKSLVPINSTAPYVEVYEIWNVGSHNLVLSHQDGAGTAADRFLLASGFSKTLFPNDRTLIRYDPVATRWIDAASTAIDCADVAQYKGSALTGNQLMTSQGGILTELGAMTDGQLPVGQTGAVPLAKTISSDATLAASGALTLKNSGVTAATYGDASHYPTITVDAQGRVTSASNTAVPAVAPLHLGATTNVGATTQNANSIGTGGSPTALASGQDSHGTLSLTTGGAGLAAGDQVSVAFGSAFASAPAVVLYPSNDKAAQIGTAIGLRASATVSAFKLTTTGALTINTTYTWNYHVLGTG